jgi:uncharacterized protein YciI
MKREHFFFKLIPPRPTFIADMTPDELALMEEHAHYTRAAQAAGEVLIAGPVLAHDGVFGMAVLAMSGEPAARAFAENDPSVRAGLNTFAIYPMRVLDSGTPND